MKIAGYNREPQPDMHIDYKDVLEQAVANERWRILREVRKAADGVPTYDGRTYSSSDRSARDVKNDILAAIDRIMNS